MANRAYASQRHLAGAAAGRPIVALFDIDGTLVDTGGAGGGAMLDAFQREFGLPHARPVELHGRTDLGIMTELLENHSVPASADNLERLSSLYFRTLPGELIRRPGKQLPGVAELLGRVSREEHIRLGLLTGNLPTSARLKLQHFGLWEHFEFGVYGDQARHRPGLAAAAWQLISAHVAGEMSGEQIVVIGDTPLDMELALAMQVRSLAVCTGGFDARQLASAGATYVIQDLSQTDAVLDWIQSGV